jgi:hypothetical protein
MMKTLIIKLTLVGFLEFWIELWIELELGLELDLRLGIGKNYKIKESCV